jgi:hypothetical protein
MPKVQKQFLVVWSKNARALGSLLSCSAAQSDDSSYESSHGNFVEEM